MYTIGGVMMHKDRDGNMLMHSAKGQEWDHHKYVDKVKGKDGKWHYIYNTSKSPVSPTVNEIKQMKEEGIEFDYSAVNGPSKTSNSPQVTDDDIDKVTGEIENVLMAYGSGNRNYFSQRILANIREIVRRALTGESKAKVSGGKNYGRVKA